MYKTSQYIKISIKSPVLKSLIQNMALNKITDLKYNSNTTRVGTDLKYTVYT